MGRRKDRTQVSIDTEQIPKLEAIAEHWRTNNSAAMRQGIDYLYEQLINQTDTFSLPELKEAANNLDKVSALELAAYIIDTLKEKVETEDNISNYSDLAIELWKKAINGDKLNFPDLSRLAGATGKSIEDVQELIAKIENGREEISHE